MQSASSMSKDLVPKCIRELSFESFLVCTYGITTFLNNNFSSVFIAEHSTHCQEWWREKGTSQQASILTNSFFFSPFLFTGCKIQAGSSACGRCCHWRRGGGSHWAPRGLQSGRNCSCTWWWDFGLHRWKIDPEEKTKTDWAGLFQLPGAFLPKSQKIQLKHEFIMTRDRSAVAVLMTDLQPHALNTRLGCVNVCEILPAVLLMGVGGNGNARTLELPLFRCDKLHQSFKNYLVTSFNYGILRWATCPAGVLEGRGLVLSCTKRPSDSTEGETWKTWVLSHERHDQFFPFSFIFVLICELPMCSKRSSISASAAPLEDCPQRILLLHGSSAPWHTSGALQMGWSAKPQPCWAWNLSLLQQCSWVAAALKPQSLAPAALCWES